MKLLFMAALALSLMSCTGTGIEAALSQLKLEAGEKGSVCMRGNIDINQNPFVTTNVSFLYWEHTGEPTASPNC